MDPFSLSGGSAGLAALCFSVCKGIYETVDRSRLVESGLKDLCQEIESLSTVLGNIRDNWRSVSREEARVDSLLWHSVKDSLDDCKDVLAILQQKVDEVRSKNSGGPTFVRRFSKQISLDMKEKDINLLKQRVQSYNSAIQSAFHMINLFV